MVSLQLVFLWDLGTEESMHIIRGVSGGLGIQTFLSGPQL